MTCPLQLVVFGLGGKLWTAYILQLCSEIYQVRCEQSSDTR